MLKVKLLIYLLLRKKSSRSKHTRHNANRLKTNKQIYKVGTNETSSVFRFGLASWSHE